jgi:hypothetical protein
MTSSSGAGPPGGPLFRAVIPYLWHFILIDYLKATMISAWRGSNVVFSLAFDFQVLK